MTRQKSPNPKMSDEEYNLRLVEFRRKMEKIIQEHGYMIQGVMNGADSFAYTIGRFASGKPELFMSNYHVDYMDLINEAVRRWDAGEIKLGEVFESEAYICAETGKPSRAVLLTLPITQALREEKMPGAFNRVPLEGALQIGVIELIAADEQNEIPADLWWRVALPPSEDPNPTKH